MIKIELKDGAIIEVEKGSSIIDVAKKISEGLARVTLAGLVNGEVQDLRHKLTEDCKLEILTFDSLEGKKAYWHTTSHIMAQAIKRLYPEIKLAIGPSIDNGFYYDFDTENQKAQFIKKIFTASCTKSFCHAAEKIKHINLPWGVMCGIRPAKIVRELMEEGHSDSEVVEILKKIYDLTINNFNQSSCEKFVKRMFIENAPFILSKRTLEELKHELISLKNYKGDENFCFDLVYISEYDKIITSKNQLNFWNNRNEKIIMLNCGHFPFSNFESLNESLMLNE